MEQRELGTTALRLSVLSFGCGAVGGLMVRGTAAEQEQAVARALELGINYFDTAPMYGDGASERNLGRALRVLRPRQAYVGTKVWLTKSEMQHPERAISAALEASLRRLGEDYVDLYQLHNPISTAGVGDTLDLKTVLERIAPVFQRLREQGKCRYCGFTALGETNALLHLIDAHVFDSAQVTYNLLNPSAGAPLPLGYPAQDYMGLLQRAAASGTGMIGIRVLAGGALSATTTRHPLGMPMVEPIGSGHDYAADVRRAQQLAALIEEGHADDLIEAALRFVTSGVALTSALVGYSTIAQLEHAAASVNKGTLSACALARIGELQSAFVGQSR